MYTEDILLQEIWKAWDNCSQGNAFTGLAPMHARAMAICSRRWRLTNFHNSGLSYQASLEC